MSNDKIVQLSPDKIKFNTAEEAIESIRKGGFVVVADDEDRENEGDLICAASMITPAMVNFMTKEARGLVCVAMPNARAEALNLYPMVQDNTDPQQTAFTVSIDATEAFGVTTGISASDRATTIQCLVSETATPDDFNRPGHIFPLLAKSGGVLRRVGHTEAAIDLARLAGLPEMGVICEILNDDGSMARRDDLASFAKKHGVPFITIAQLIEYRMQSESERFVVRKLVKDIETKYGRFTAVGYKDIVSGVEHLALVKGSLEQLKQSAPPVRVQHENMLLEILGENDEESVQHMTAAMTYINAEGSGVVIYLRSQDGTPQSMLGTLKAYGAGITKTKKTNAATSDLRDYGVGAQILADLGVKQFRLITNTPKKIVALRGFGLDVTETLQMPSGSIAFAPKEKTETQASASSEAKFVAKNENVKAETKPVESAPAKQEAPVELKAEQRMMRMGGQIISNQALFEG